MKAQLLVLIERYLLALTRSVLKKYRPVIIGITGSVGKTTTKEAIAHVLKENGLHLRRTSGNLNADMGIALTVLGYDHSPAIWEWPLAIIAMHLHYLFLILGLTHFPPYFIVEFGVDRLGDMERMLQTIRPTIGIVTWIGEGHHLEYLKDTATIAQEKGQLLAHLPKKGLAIIPASDPQTAALEKLATAPVVKINETGLDAVPAIVRAVAGYLRLKPEKVASALATYKPPKGRLHELAGINGSTIIDDTYNSSFPAVKLGLEILAAHKGKRKVAVLGDLLEQGAKEGEMHQTVAELAKQKADFFVGVGKRMKKVETDLWFPSPDKAAAALPALIQNGDVILVKGSQGLRMEKVSFALAADKTEARQELPRQNARWQQIPFANP